MNLHHGERAAFLDALVEHAPDIIIYVDHEGKIQFINRVVGDFDREKVIGASWLSFVPAVHHSLMTRAFAKALKTGEAVDYELEGPGTDGKPTWYWTRICPMKLGGRVTGAVLIARDVTERKLLETKLQLTERLASLGTLAAGIGHEINNPLAYSMLNLEMLESELGAKSTPASEKLSKIRSALERIQRIVLDLKAFSRTEAREAETLIDVHEILDEAINMASNEIRHRAMISKAYCPALFVRGVKTRIGQVYLNLIVNAAQAIAEGHASENTIGVTTRLTSDGHAEIVISDTGEGIAPENLKRIFDPFFTTKPVGIGTGLGLSICHGIIQSLGGAIRIESELGRGTQCIITLPNATVEREVTADSDPTRQSNPEPPVSAPLQPDTPTRVRILIIDDVEQLSETLREVLSATHDVVTAATGKAAIELLSAKESAPFDVILCDLMLPDTTGMDIHEEVSRLQPGTESRIVFMTGGAFTDRAKRFLAKTPNRCLSKPFTIAELNRVLRPSASRR